jgi:outer membrane protein OmpA-like peptidoglycan-associated protein
MEKSVIFLLVGTLLLLAACDPQAKTQQQGYRGTGGESGRGSEVAEVTGGAMERMEHEMRQALAASEAAIFQRQGELLRVVLKGELCFDEESAAIQPLLDGELDRIIQVLKQYPQTVIRVEGHTDSIGTDSWNMELSHGRAQAVKTGLVQRGIHDSRIQVLAFGRSQPIAADDDDAGRRENSRVEIGIQSFPVGGQ